MSAVVDRVAVQTLLQHVMMDERCGWQGDSVGSAATRHEG